MLIVWSPEGHAHDGDRHDVQCMDMEESTVQANLKKQGGSHVTIVQSGVILIDVYYHAVRRDIQTSLQTAVQLHASRRAYIACLSLGHNWQTLFFQLKGMLETLEVDLESVK
jgi:hypothetical protein